MDWLLRLFDLFLNTSRQLAGYLPQSGSDLIQLFQKFLALGANLNLWLADNIGVNLQAALAPLGKLVFIAVNFFWEAVKAIVARL